MTVLETVYAIQNFDAENEDELSFQIGEPIIIIQKDDGFNDGWWKGENTHGEIGLFPMSYITYREEPLACHQQQLAQLPTPSSSDVVMTKKTTAPIDLFKIFNEYNEHNNEPRFSLGQSSYSFTCPMGPTTSAATAALSNQLGGSSNIAIRRLVIKALFLPALRSTPPAEWNVNQVEIWLTAMNFQGVATIFKSQEITGDILLELNMGSLKELDVSTFGKRYKIHTAIRILRNECGLKNQPKRVSVCSPTCFDDYLENVDQSNENNASTYPTEPWNNKAQQSTNENTKHHNHLKSCCSSSGKEDFDDDGDGYQSLPSPYPTSSSSPLTPTSTVDISDLKRTSYFEHLSGDDEFFLSSENSNMYTMQQGQYNQAMLPSNSRSTLEMYCNEETENVAPDMEGWLYKQGCKYKKWNKRWFVLKGPNLFYFKSPKDVRMKGIINLRGYKIVVDETIQPGKYSFKAQHEEERTFFFYTDMEHDMRAWISSLLKATILRDFAAPVLSSSVIPTVSLEVARRMRPRPPSVLIHRKGGAAVSRSSPIRLSSKTQNSCTVATSLISNASAHSGCQSPLSNSDKSLSSTITSSNSITHTITTTASSSTIEEEPLSDIDEDSGFDINNPKALDDFSEKTEDADDNKTLTLQEALDETLDIAEKNFHYANNMLTEGANQKTFIDVSSWSTKELIAWVNTICTKAKISSLKEVRQGEILRELLQNISSKQIEERSASSARTTATVSMLMLDNIVDAFKFMATEGVILDNSVTVKDIYSGNEEKIMLLLKSIIQWSISLQHRE